MKKMIRFALAAVAAFAFASCTSVEPSNSTTEAETSSQKIKSAGLELTAAMKIGWNLGNTLDAWTDENNGLDSETCWGQPKTTPEMFAGLKKAGFNVVRIPITWHNHFIDDNYTVDPNWMARCKEIVDMALNAGLYAIINVHHDTAPSAEFEAGRGYYPTESAKEKSVAFLTRVWEQICAEFKDYDNHLVFELMNEPRLVGHEREWWYDTNEPDCATAQGVIIGFEEEIIKTIRASGEKNADRFLMVPGYVAQPWAAMADSFYLPADSTKDRLILSVHMYDPWTFAGENPGISEFTQEARDNLKGTFEALHNNFIAKGVPVIIGECGATNKNNLAEREAWYSYYFETSKKNGITAILWDNGSTEVPEDGNVSEHFGFYNRTEQTFFFPTLLKNAMDAVAAGEKAAQ